MVRKILKNDAVPSIFEHCHGWENLHKVTTFQRKPPKEREPFQYQNTGQTNINIEETQTQPSISTVTANVETNNSLLDKIKMLEEEIKRKDEMIIEKDKNVKELEQKLHMEKWGVHRFSFDNDKIKYYTGFISYDLFLKFFESVRPSAQNMISAYYVKLGEKRSLAGRPRTLQLIDELFLFLMRVRQAFGEKDLAERFKITEQSVSRKVITWTSLLYLLLGSIPIWISKEDISKTMPPCFKKLYPLTRVIIDCTEIPTQYASSLVLNSQLYSSYKSRPTFKCLVGVAPSGAFTFISHLFCGSMSDVAIVKMSGILDLLEESDSVMADKGFKISKLLEEKGVFLNLPPFLSNMNQFTPEEVQQTEEIASVRIHVERAIGRVKEYKIFDKVPLSMMGSINQIWTICCLLTCFQPPLIKATSL